MQISAVIIVKNGAKTIANTLDSLKEFNDVVVYDNGSTDGTQEITKKYDNVNLIEGDFLGFGPTKNKAVSYAKHDWILILDSDEVIDETLLQTLKSKKLNKNCVYLLNFQAYYKDIRIKHCGWSNQKKRIYHRHVTRLNDNLLHENIIDKGLMLVELQGNVKHYSYSSISDFIIKSDRYSTIFANENVGKKSSSPFKAFANATSTFIKIYILKKGFLDGYAGLVVSVSQATSNFYKYIKLYEKNKELIK